MTVRHTMSVFHGLSLCNGSSLGFFHVCFRLRLGNEPYSEADQNDGKSLAGLEYTDAGEDGDRYRHQWLHIIVYTDHCGAQGVLAYHH